MRVAANGILILTTVFVLGALGLEHYWLRSVKFDDAWIHFRYAEHLSHGDGFVYNVGQRVLGSGGVLWEFVLAAVAAATRPDQLSGAVSLLNYAALLSSFATLFLVFRRLVSAPLSILFALVIVSVGAVPVSSIGGMETTLMFFLYTLVFLGLIGKRFVAYVLPPFTGFVLIQFFLLQAFPFDRVIPSHASQWTGFVLWMALVALGYLHIRRRHSPAAFLLIHIVGVATFYSLANVLVFPWYACTFVPFAMAFAMLGSLEIAGALHRSPAWVTLPILLVWGSAWNTTWTLVPLGSVNFPWRIPNASENLRTYRYGEIADWLNARSSREDWVCVPEIGAFGFHYHGNILDPVGLVSPEAAPYQGPRPVGERFAGVIPPQLVKDYKPRFVVSMDIFSRALVRDAWFRDHYREIGRWPWLAAPGRWEDAPASLWGGEAMYAYELN